VLTPSVKGSIAEAVIAAGAVKAGVVVLRPLVEGRRYLLFDVGHRLLRVQCKMGRRQGDVVVVRSR
jgi:PD-(D/E)XK endonuclease